MTATNRLLSAFNKPQEGVVAASPLLGKVMDAFRGERKENSLNGLSIGKERERSGGSLGAPAHQCECAWKHRHAAAPPGAGSSSEQLEHAPAWT